MENRSNWDIGGWCRDGVGVYCFLAVVSPKNLDFCGCLREADSIGSVAR